MNPTRSLAPFPVVLVGLVALASALHTQEHSVYVPMDDGTRIALDVYLPEAPEAEDGADGVPALVELTRYWRSSESVSGEPANALGGLDRAFLGAGYALVKVDVRGSGASFGSRSMEYGRAEVRDGYAIVDWIAAQPWCDGNVGAFGTSYSGTTAELLAASGHPALKAVIPGWSDFDLYVSPARPYGLFPKLIDQWGTLVGQLDANRSDVFGGCVRRVHGDVDGALRAEAVQEHADNVDVDEAARAAEFRDDRFTEGGDGYEHGTPIHWKSEIEAAGVPMLVLASWLDAGTADGALQRLRSFSNPQTLVILASSHGGGAHASPYVVDARPRPPVPSVAEQVQLRIRFFDHHLKGADNGVPDWPRVRYHNLGEEVLLESDAWPVPGTTTRRLFLREEAWLSDDAPPGDSDTSAFDEYEVDFGVTTGPRTRWSTQLGGVVTGLSERGEMDERMLVYTTDPLEEALQVTGTPVVTLRLSSDHADGAVLVYLEDVAPDGRSRYVTEGGLRLLHHRAGIGAPEPSGPPPVPVRTFARADASSLEPGEVVDVVVPLWPTSVLFERGHSIRLAIAGADEDTFERVPAVGTPVLRVSRSAASSSFLELPTLDR